MKVATLRSGVFHCDAKLATDVVHRCLSGIYLLDPSSSARTEQLDSSDTGSKLFTGSTVAPYRRESPSLGLGHRVPLCQGAPVDRAPHKPVHLLWKHTATTWYIPPPMDAV